MREGGKDCAKSFPATNREIKPRRPQHQPKSATLYLRLGKLQSDRDRKLSPPE